MEFPKSGYAYCAHDTLEQMNQPPVEFWPVYSWTWCGEITDEGILSRLDSMLERGIRSLYILPLPGQFTKGAEGEKVYLSDAYMAQLRFAVEEAKKRGMQLWMYDEGGWPSGSANGYVVREHPELEAYAMDATGNRKPIPPAAQPYPDLLNRKSTETFLQLTHERYKEVFDGNYGIYFPLTFTDEPHVRTLGDDNAVPWSDGLEARFRETFGYDLTEHLPVLMGHSPKNEEERKIRADFKDLLGRLFAENYFLPLRDWCRANGSLLTGHVGGDDVAFGNARWGYHHILRCLRAMDVPGVDVIWRQVFPGQPVPGPEPYAPLCGNRLFPRYASSAAHQTGARLAMTESYAIYGNGITYDQMRWVYNFQVVRGINVLNPMNMSFSYAGRRGATVGQPTFAPNLPGYLDLNGFNLWAARVNYLMSAGKPVADAALFMPMRDIWPGDAQAQLAAERFEAVGAELERRGCDFDVADEDAILAAQLRGGALCVGDAAYRTVYLQDGTVSLSSATREKLDAFVKAGGTVTLCVGSYRVTPIVEADNCEIRAIRRTVAEGTLYYITNEGYGAVSAQIRFPEESAVQAWEIDVLTGVRKAVSVTPYSCDLALGAERVLLFAVEIADQVPEETPEKIHGLVLNNFAFRRLRKVCVEPDGYVDHLLQEAPVSIRTGDWRTVAGDDFSGDAEYSTEFMADAAMAKGALLDLGAVGYTCEVFLNGVSLGAKIFSPFVYELPVKEGRNELRIRVSNTMANAFEAADFHWIPDYEPDFHAELQSRFRKDSLSSGLFGPVQLRW